MTTKRLKRQILKDLTRLNKKLELLDGLQLDEDCSNFEVEMIEFALEHVKELRKLVRLSKGL